MLTIKKQINAKAISVKQLGYKYNTKSKGLTLYGEEVYTITDSFLEEYVVDTTTNTILESTYLLLETNLYTDVFDFPLYWNEVLHEIPIVFEEQEYTDFLIKFYPIKGYTNYVVAIKNKTNLNCTIKIHKQFIKTFGNHINNVDGQIVGNSLLLDTTMNAARNCYLPTINKNSSLDLLTKLKEKVLNTVEENFTVFYLTGAA